MQPTVNCWERSAKAERLKEERLKGGRKEANKTASFRPSNISTGDSHNDPPRSG
jgi:hypothetical protein